jgi:hypothetical protein
MSSTYSVTAWKFSLVPIVNKEVIPILLLTVKKVDSNGEFKKFKSRVVARGDLQDCLDPVFTSSPVVRHSTVQILLNKFVSTRPLFGLSILDISSAYLETPLETEEIFIKLDEKTSKLIKGLVPYPLNLSPDGTLVARLKKYLYGLKQSAKKWYLLMKSRLEEFGFKCSARDPGLFTMGTNENFQAVTLYVDDMVSYGSSLNREKLNLFLKSKFKSVKVIDDPDRFDLLGVNYKLQDDGSLSVSISHITQNLAAEFGVKATRRHPFCDPPQHFRQVMLERSDITKFRRGVAKLLYLARQPIRYILYAIL